MAEALILRIGNLIPELLAHALSILCLFQTAGTIAPFFLQTVPNHLNDLFIGIKGYFHNKYLHFSSTAAIADKKLKPPPKPP